MQMADRLALPGRIKAATLEEVAASQKESVRIGTRRPGDVRSEREET